MLHSRIWRWRGVSNSEDDTMLRLAVLERSGATPYSNLHRYQQVGRGVAVGVLAALASPMGERATTIVRNGGRCR